MNEKLDLSVVKNLCDFFEILTKDRKKYTEAEKTAHLHYVLHEIKKKPMIADSMEQRLIFKCDEGPQKQREKYLAYAEAVSCPSNADNNCIHFFCAVCIIFGDEHANDGCRERKSTNSGKKSISPFRTTGFCSTKYAIVNKQLNAHEKTQFHIKAYNKYLSVNSTNGFLERSIDLPVSRFPATDTSILATLHSTASGTTTIITTTSASSSSHAVRTISSSFKEPIVSCSSSNNNLNTKLDAVPSNSHPKLNILHGGESKVEMESDANSININRGIVYDVIYCVLFLVSFGMYINIMQSLWGENLSLM